MTGKRWKVVGAAALVLVLVAALALVLVRVLGGDDAEERARAARSADARFDQAILLAPDDAQRVLWTDWGAVRDELGLDLDASSTPAQVDDLVERAFEADLSTATALGESAVAMQESLGFSPASLAWEMFSQSDAAATLVLHLGEGASFDDVADDLRAVGYVEPDAPDGVWASDSDLSTTGDVTPELNFIALDRAHGLLLASDTGGGVTLAQGAVADAGPSDIPAAVVADLDGPTSALAFDATYACSALAMANADASEQTAADALLAQAGKINPLTGLAIGSRPGGSVRFSLGFENNDQARANADTRARLVAGEAPGQGGSFTDRFDVEQVAAEGDVVRIDVEPLEGEYVISDLSSGPLLFATC